MRSRASIRCTNVQGRARALRPALDDGAAGAGRAAFTPERGAVPTLSADTRRHVQSREGAPRLQLCHWTGRVSGPPSNPSAIAAHRTHATVPWSIATEPPAACRSGGRELAQETGPTCSRLPGRARNRAPVRVGHGRSGFRALPPVAVAASTRRRQAYGEPRLTGEGPGLVPSAAEAWAICRQPGACPHDHRNRRISTTANPASCRPAFARAVAVPVIQTWRLVAAATGGVESGTAPAFHVM